MLMQGYSLPLYLWPEDQDPLGNRDEPMGGTETKALGISFLISVIDAF